MMRKLLLCLFYGLCAFTIAFSLYWMSLPRIELSPSTAPSREDPSPLSLAAQTVPGLSTGSYYLCDEGGKVAVYHCGADGSLQGLLEMTDIYVNLLPENDALRLKNGITVHTRQELDLLLEDLGG